MPSARKPKPPPEHRTETWVTRRPNGDLVRVWRNIDTGEHRVTPVSEERASDGHQARPD